MLAVGAVMATVALAGCGGSSTHSLSVPNGNGGTTKVAVPSLGGSKFCSSLQSAVQKLESGELSQLSNPSTAASASSEVAPEISLYKSLASSAPSAIKGNLERLATGLQALEKDTSVLSKDASDPSALTAAAQKEEAASAKLASDEGVLGTYVAQHCA